jgi:hypothetical protein
MIDQYLKPNVKQGAIYYAVVSIVLGIVMLIPLLNCLVAPLACVVGILLPFAIGWLVAQWGKTMPATATPLAVQSTSPYTTPAVDGAVAAGVGALVSGIIVWVISLIFSGVFASIGAASGSQSAGGAALGVAIGGAFGIVGVITGTIIGAILGAIGGVLYVVFNQRRATTA